MTPEQQIIVEQNHSLIYSFLKKYHLSADYYGDAAIGLCMAAMKYDPSAGAQFSTYAYASMYNHCIKARQDDAKHESNLSLNAPRTEDETATLLDALPDIMGTENLQSCIYIDWILDVLPLTDLKIVLGRLKGLPMKEIGQELGFSKQAVLNHLEIIREAIHKNRKNRRWHATESPERNKVIVEIKELLFG